MLASHYNLNAMAVQIKMIIEKINKTKNKIKIKAFTNLVQAKIHTHTHVYQNENVKIAGKLQND